MDLVNIKLRDSLDGTGDLVANFNGNEIFNRADWKNWKRVNVFKAAIAMVIQNRDLNVQYKDFCPKCRANFLKELECLGVYNGDGCNLPRHKQSALILNSGNPFLHSSIKNAVDVYKNPCSS